MDDSLPDDYLDIDKYLDSCGSTTVRKSVGNPSFRPLAEIPPQELEGEVERILNLLADHMIEVELDECGPAEAYRFLTTELMAEEIEDPRAPRWWACFLYSEIHPKPGKDDREENPT